MSVRCSYCEKEYQWLGLDYHFVNKDSFCSAVCANIEYIDKNLTHRFCVNCGNEFYSTDKSTAPNAFLCDNCRRTKEIRERYL